jgi:hypothetical protein
MYIPQIYSTLEKSDTDSSRPEMARVILIVGQETALRYSKSWFQIAWLSAIKSLVGFGYIPELGFVWIFAIVFMASVSLWLGRQEVTSKYKPDNWFVWFLFSLNAVLPGITLDKKFEEVRFNGLHQYLLYTIEFLGAIVVLLVVFFIRRLFLPTD